MLGGDPHRDLKLQDQNMLRARRLGAEIKLRTLSLGPGSTVWGIGVAVECAGQRARSGWG